MRGNECQMKETLLLPRLGGSLDATAAATVGRLLLLPDKKATTSPRHPTTPPPHHHPPAALFRLPLKMAKSLCSQSINQSINRRQPLSLKPAAPNHHTVHFVHKVRAVRKGANALSARSPGASPSPMWSTSGSNTFSLLTSFLTAIRANAALLRDLELIFPRRKEMGRCIEGLQAVRESCSDLRTLRITLAYSSVSPSRDSRLEDWSPETMTSLDATVLGSIPSLEKIIVTARWVVFHGQCVETEMRTGVDWCERMRRNLPSR